MSARKLPSLVSQLILTEYCVRPESIVYADFNQSQLDGSQPFVVRRAARTNVEVDASALIPDDMEISRRV